MRSSHGKQQISKRGLQTSVTCKKGQEEVSDITMDDSLLLSIFKVRSANNQTEWSPRAISVTAAQLDNECLNLIFVSCIIRDYALYRDA